MCYNAFNYYLNTCILINVRFWFTRLIKNYSADTNRDAFDTDLKRDYFSGKFALAKLNTDVTHYLLHNEISSMEYVKQI